MAKTKTSTNMTEGSIIKNILLFAIPVFIGNIFQQLYNVADTAVVGNILGDEALAAVGASAPIYNLIIGFANGMTNGFSVIIARFFGANDKKKMLQSISLTYVLTACVSLVLTIGSLLFLHPILKLLKTPAAIISDTEGYLRIILVFSVITMAYNMFASMMRAVGNSRTPIYFLMLAAVINVILDIVFIKYLALGISGAAYATVIAQSISVSLCFIYCVKKCNFLLFSKKNFVWDKKLTADLFTTGLSMGLMLALTATGSVILQSGVNSFGAKTVTSHAAARKIDELFMQPLGTLSLAASTFTSQNYGAGKIDRVKKGIAYSIYIAFAWSLFSLAITFLFNRPMLKLLTGTSDMEIINTASTYLKINVPFFLTLSVLLILRSSLQGVGRKLVPLTGSFIELVLKILAVALFAPLLGYLGICIVEPATWVICSVVLVVDYVVFLKKVFPS